MITALYLDIYLLLKYFTDVFSMCCKVTNIQYCSILKCPFSVIVELLFIVLYSISKEVSTAHFYLTIRKRKKWNNQMDPFIFQWQTIISPSQILITRNTLKLGFQKAVRGYYDKDKCGYHHQLKCNNTQSNKTKCILMISNEFISMILLANKELI